MPWPKGIPFPPAATAKRVETLKRNGKRARKPRTVNGMVEWQCSRCKTWLPSTAFYAKKRSLNGLTTQCRKCHGECNVRTRDTAAARDANREHMRKAREANPERFRERERRRPSRHNTAQGRARNALNKAVRAGKIKRPAFCERCGCGRRVQGHHPDYSRPLDVEWLCVACHASEHRRKA